MAKKIKSPNEAGGRIVRETVTLAREKAGITREIARIDRNAPDFDSVFDDGDDNPFAGIDQDDLQDAADETMSEALRLIIEQKKASQERFRIVADPEFFLVVCFQSRDQKEDFLKKANWDDLGDKYINGLEVARRMGVDTPAISIEPLKVRGKLKLFKASEILRKE